MKKTIFLLALLTTSPLTYSSQDIPFPPKHLQKYSSNYDSKNFTRLRLNITTTGSNFNSNSNIRSQDIVFCGKKECFQASSNTYINPIINDSGNSSLILDTLIPINKNIEKIYFNNNKNSSDTINGNIALDKDIQLSNEYPGYQILVELKKDSNNTIRPVFATSEYYRSDIPAIFYNPERNVSFKLKSNFEVNIPSNSLKKPKIFLVMEDDVKQNYPLLDIYPHILMDKNISISSNNSTTIQSRSKAANSDANIIVDRTRSFRPQDFEDSQKSIRTLATAANQSCEQILQKKMGDYNNLLKKNGIVEINDCTNIEPYIHIIYINHIDKNRQFLVPIIPYTNSSPKQDVKLTSIVNYSNAAKVGINGFIWSGEDGTAYGQKGTLLGLVVSNNQVFGNNFRNLQHLVFNRDPTTVTFGQSKGLPSNYKPIYSIQVGSTTSIIKSSNIYDLNNIRPITPGNNNYNCSSDTTDSRWSAIGGGNLGSASNTIGKGVTLMVSSTSSGTTTAKRLCPIFKIFSIPNAIRLDGGPSASMMVNGVLVNPLQGLYRVKYGNARNIAYPILVR